MKKRIAFVVTILVLSSFITLGQSPNWLWAKRGGGSNIDITTSVVTDATGNVYVAGYFNSWPAIFGPDTLYTSGANDIFLVKYSATGNVIWAKSIGGNGNPDYECDDKAYSVAADINGNIYVAGTFTSPFITFGSTTLTKAGSNYTDADVFLAKYDANGIALWAKSGAGGSGINYAYSVCTDNSGYVYLAGTYASSSITFDTEILSSGNLFLTKYNSSGNVIWAKSSAGNISGPLSIAANTSGNIFMTGSFYGNTITFGTTTLSHTGGLGYHMFLLKYDATGNILWAKGENGNFDDYGYSVAVDASGNVYVAGAFLSTTVIFGSFTLNNSATAPAYDSYLLKYNTAGTVIWAKSFDGSTGSSWPGSSGRPYSVVADAFGNVYVAGVFNCSSITFGTTVLTNSPGSGYFDIFLVKYNNTGNVLAAKSIGGNSDDFAYAVAADIFGNVYIAGTFSSPAIIVGGDTLTNASYNRDALLAKLETTVYTGIEAPDNANNNFVVYPNPSNGVFTVYGSLSGINSLDIYDIMGQKVFHSEKLYQKTSAKIDVSGLPKGIYFIKINEDKGSDVIKIVIQ